MLLPSLHYDVDNAKDLHLYGSSRLPESNSASWVTDRSALHVIRLT